ncbi:DUF3048 domain-containing protein [Saccharopolyspora sp. MS10]|uniref:DUF3048 domain-containing protein n=1 Tax=Saccharopolyspora sp. MS10 TaxID=3385973 RepID=UPI00399FCFB8
MGRIRGLPARVAVLLAVLVTVLAAGLGCQPSGGERAEAPGGSAPTPSEDGSSAAPPVLAVKIDNVPEARPATGLGAADLVVVEPVEGGLSRLIALFGAQRPPVVGPVRSARETDLDLLPQFGHPALAYSGAAPELLPRLDDAPLDAVRPEQLPGAFFRGEDRPLPHNLYVRPADLPPGAPWAQQSRPRVGPAPAGGEPRESAQVDYRAASTGFTWSPQEHRWLVSMDGAPAVTTDGGRLGAGTVVLQQVEIRDSQLSDSKGSVTPHAQTVGSGRAVVLRDGQAFDARWSRPSPEAPTAYTTASGEPLPFAPGQVWVALTDRL